jgi:hypothetical protein
MSADGIISIIWNAAFAVIVTIFVLGLIGFYDRNKPK